MSQQIDALYELAFKEKAFAATVELQWFLTEQVEEEKSAREIVAKFRWSGTTRLRCSISIASWASRSGAAEPSTPVRRPGCLPPSSPRWLSAGSALRSTATRSRTRRAGTTSRRRGTSSPSRRWPCWRRGGDQATSAEDAVPAAPPPPIQARQAVTGVAVAIAISVALYWPTLWLGLLSDDYVLLELPLLPGDRWEFVRPLPLLLWSVVHPVAGPPGLHALNVILHGVNGALLAALTLAIVPAARFGVGLLAAALFLMCPLAVEPVAWAAGVFDTLLVTWALAYLLALVYAPGPRWAIAGALVCLSAALATKESAVALPLLGALLAIRRRVSWMAIAASAAVCAVYATLRVSD